MGSIVMPTTGGGTKNAAIFAQNGINASTSASYTESYYNPYIDTDYFEYISGSGSGHRFNMTFKILKDCDVLALVSSSITLTFSSANSYLNADSIVPSVIYSSQYTRVGHLKKDDTMTIATSSSSNNIIVYIVIGNKDNLTEVTDLGMLNGNW